MKAWITYSYNDRDFVQKLMSSLNDPEIQFLDVEQDILPGDNIVDKIYKSISTSDIVIIVLSKESVSKKWFSTEIGILISEIRNNPSKRIFPVLKEKEVDIPPFIDQYQFLDLSDKNSFNERVQLLKRAIKSPRTGTIGTDESDLQASNVVRSKQELLEREKEIYERKRKEKQRLVYLTTLMTVLISFLTLFVFIFSSKGIFDLDDKNLITTFMLVIVGAMTGVIVSLILTKIKENKDDR